jgi:uncharacterized protein
MPMPHSRIGRREMLLGSAATMALWPGDILQAASQGTAGAMPATARPFPLSAVRLAPSPFLTAIEANRRYLMALEPDRLLHNFRKHAGLPPKGDVYGGWESDTIAGHTLGHYLTALSLMHAQTGDTECKRRASYIVGELAACQAAAGDGYVSGFTRRRGEAFEDGKLIFPEIMAGDIRSAGFDLNGCWVPFYTWHKLFAGLFDAQTLTGNTDALPIAVALGGYVDRVFAALDDAQVQRVLDCEHGGINESFAELYVRTGDPRWLRLAERLRHRKVLDPLAKRENSLPWIHANTQIPKVIGLARLHEITGDGGNAVAARFFWDTVVRQYSYAIGGNADREYFPAPNTVSKHITEQTCESCNTYNMLKLTRHLYAWQPHAQLFDFYERAHINHMLAHQDPATGMFAYMVPLASGAHRKWSTPFDNFWCCVGTGIETHAKHGDSIWWTGGDTLIANLYIPSTLDWADRGAQVSIITDFPFAEAIDIRIDRLAAPARFALALRIPAWTKGATIAVNGRPEPATIADGYAVVRRRWRAGDRVTLTLPMRLWAEPTPDDPQTVALLHGPVVLAADMGAVDRPFDGTAPALVSSDLIGGFEALSVSEKTFRTTGIGRPADLAFAPFYRQTQRRTAVYFRHFSEPQWATEQQAYAAEQTHLAALEARSVDIMHLGEMQPERDHGLEAANSHVTVYRGRHGRDVRDDGFFQFRMTVRPGSLTLQATYWGEERNRDFVIMIDGQQIARQRLDGEQPGRFFDIDYQIPEALTRGKSSVTVRFQPSARLARGGPVFGVRLYAATYT